MTITVEAQFDPERETVTLVASSGLTSRYTVTVAAYTKDDADEKLRQFRDMYRRIENA
jgi:hypothetical protein